MKNNIGFFEGLKQSEAFGFTMNQSGEFIPIDNPNYCFYDGSTYPFVEFADELKSLNDYCYAVSQLIHKKRTQSGEAVEKQRRKSGKFEDFGAGFTSAEIMMGLEDEDFKWGWLSDITGAHLVILLYSFLEKTLKYICKCYLDEKLKDPDYKKKRPAVNYYLYNILGTDEESFQKSEPEIYRILNEARKMRNNFAHDNLEGEDSDDGNHRNAEPDFKLIDLINTVSSVLYQVEHVLEGSK